MTSLDTARMLVLLAVRNLFSHRVKSSIVGLILVFGTLLLVLGSALVDSIERAMERSITASVAGHLQVYSAKGKDELSLFGGEMMGADDIGRVDDFSKLRDAIAKVDGVKAVVPMGIDFASITSPGPLEDTLADLREAVRDGAPSGALVEQVKEILRQMKAEREKSATIAKDTEKLEAEIERIEEGLSDALWARFEAEPLAVLEVLDTRIAPLAEAGRMHYFRYLGTDVDRFVEHFDRFRVVEGERIPPHTRGLMFHRRFYERRVKHRIARRLDWLKEEIHERDRSIAEYPGLEARVRRMARQYRRITFELDRQESAELEAKLHAYLPEVKGSLPELLSELLMVTDENFDERYDWFYAHVAPLIDLYAIDVGDVVTVRAYTRSGFLKAINIRLYGIFEYEGLEKSNLAGGFSLVDILTFRELYGLMTASKRAELEDIRASVGVEQVEADDAEMAFFGGDEEIVVEEEAQGFDEFAGVDLSADNVTAEVGATFRQEEVDTGLALNAAVVLDDRTKVDEMQAKVKAALDAAGLDMKVVDWQKAAGLVGQFVLVIRGVLYVAITIIFVVALVIINNSMVMATMERVTEIGTMRAIGAQRRLVLAMFLLETLVLGLLAAIVGAGVAVALVTWLGAVGLPAPSNELIFLFGGPKLYPSYEASNVILGFVVIVLVSLASTLYPAFIATRIEPVMAMRTEE